MAENGTIGGFVASQNEKTSVDNSKQAAIKQNSTLITKAEEIANAKPGDTYIGSNPSSPNASGAQLEKKVWVKGPNGEWKASNISPQDFARKYIRRSSGVKGSVNEEILKDLGYTKEEWNSIAFSANQLKEASYKKKILDISKEYGISERVIFATLLREVVINKAEADEADKKALELLKEGKIIKKGDFLIETTPLGKESNWGPQVVRRAHNTSMGRCRLKADTIDSLIRGGWYRNAPSNWKELNEDQRNTEAIKLALNFYNDDSDIRLMAAYHKRTASWWANPESRDKPFYFPWDNGGGVGDHKVDKLSDEALVTLYSRSEGPDRPYANENRGRRTPVGNDESRIFLTAVDNLILTDPFLRDSNPSDSSLVA